MLTDQEIAKIRQEAEALYPMPYPNLTSKGEAVDPLWNFYDNKNIQAGCMRESHIAAVTAERERAKGLIDEIKEVLLLPQTIGHAFQMQHIVRESIKKYYTNEQ